MNPLHRLQRLGRDTIGYQTNVMRYCPYPGQRRRACLLILPLMCLVLPLFILKVAFLGLGAVGVGILNTLKGIFIEIPSEAYAAWSGEDAISVSRWEQYQDFRAERTASEALDNG